MESIRKKVNENVWEALAQRRHEAVSVDEKMKTDALNTFGSSLFEEDVANLLKDCSQLFRVKQRVNILMIKEKDNIEKVRQETLDTISKLVKNYGMRSNSSSHTTQA